MPVLQQQLHHYNYSSARTSSLIEYLSKGADGHLAFRSSKFIGGDKERWKPLNVSVARLQCKKKLHIVPKKKDNLLAEAEKHWLRAIEHPSERLSFSKDDLSAALSRYEYSFQVGNFVKGTILLTEKSGALVEIGGKAPAFLPTNEASLVKVNNVMDAGLLPGVEEEFYILGEDEENGRMILSLKKIQTDNAWERCKQLLSEQASVMGHVISENRGGLLVTVEGIRGFVPLSQLSTRGNLTEYINKDIPLKFIDVDEEQSKIILSNKLWLMLNQASLEEGTVVEGVVQNVLPYGAFIDIGATTGLLHVSQVSKERVNNITEVLHPGDKLKVMIFKNDSKRRRITLTTRHLERSPGDMLRNPSLVHEFAEEMGRRYRENLRLSQNGATFTDTESPVQSEKEAEVSLSSI